MLGRNELALRLSDIAQVEVKMSEFEVTPSRRIASALLIYKWVLLISVVFPCDFGIDVFVMNWISFWCLFCAMLSLELLLSAYRSF